MKALVAWGLIFLGLRAAAIAWWGVPASVFEPTLPPERQSEQQQEVPREP